MSLTLEVPAELFARLTKAAQARGLPLEAYVRAVIEQAGAPDSGREADLAELRRALDALAQGSAELPVLTSEQFRRETIYQGHD
jgi:hypothetical protein